MADDPLSRRSLFRLDFGGFARARSAAERPDPEPVKASIAWRWEAGADALLRAWEPIAPAVCDAAGVREGMRVLDAGCGDGNVAIEAARRGANVTGVDMSPGQVNRALVRDPDIAWSVGDLEELAEADEIYDAVLSVYGATFAPRPRRTVRELLRVLRPGGTLVLAAPGPRSLFTAVLLLAQAGPGAIPEGLPSPAAWGDETMAARRIEAVAPGTAVDSWTYLFELKFESEADAWAAFSGPFGLAEHTRDEFADLIGTRSEWLGSVFVREPVTLVRARRPG